MNNAMEFLLEQAKEREDQAVLALNKARSELEDYYRQVEQIEKYRLDYCQQLVDPTSSFSPTISTLFSKDLTPNILLEVNLVFSPAKYRLKVLLV